MQRKCCAHCPGSVTRTGDPIREHTCNVPDYVSGNLRISSLAAREGRARSAKSSGSSNNGSRLNEQPSSCFERFATAKKFHAENLQHQPLPDRVDDAIFTANKPAEQPCMCETVRRCQKIVPRKQALRKKELSRVQRYAPILGCKKPMTYMDLAICWETPIDPSYEPQRPVHIDGSDGGPAPAIFTLVQHRASQTDVREGCIPGIQDNVGNELDDNCCERHQPCDKCLQKLKKLDAEDKEDLCKNFDSIHITSEQNGTRDAIGSAARSKRTQFMRHCVACDKNGTTKRPSSGTNRRAIRSASCLQKNGCTVVARKANGLPNRPNGIVPRPRTPYARRSFCIDTLAPPFSVVAGCRDADYPEHWRLTSIYQQSYRNPRKMREGRTILNYERSYT